MQLDITFGISAVQSKYALIVRPLAATAHLDIVLGLRSAREPYDPLLQPKPSFHSFLWGMLILLCAYPTRWVFIMSCGAFHSHSGLSLYSSRWMELLFLSRTQRAWATILSPQPLFSLPAKERLTEPSAWRPALGANAPKEERLYDV